MGPAGEPVPRFSDWRVTVRWLPVVVVLAVAIALVGALFLPRPIPALAVSVGGAAVVAAAMIVGVRHVRLPRTDLP